MATLAEARLEGLDAACSSLDYMPPPDTLGSNRQGDLTLDIANLPSINFAQSYLSEAGLRSAASDVSPDGRISIHVELENETPDMYQDHAHDVEEFAVDKKEWSDYPCMSIVIMIVGSRGDVQPYVALGKRLVEDGHRVRIATHETFRQFVTEAGLEFFNIGGNPQDLMSYMVKNPGLMPGIDSLTNGDIARKKKMLAEMIDGCWESCISPCTSSGLPFAADAIISNPPTFAHIHCAEALGIPLLLTFTMPWSHTIAFAHPLVNVTTSNPRFRLSNFLSYCAADMLTWQGIGDIINTFRTTKLGLSPLTARSGPGYIDRLKVPWTYCMSPALVPKPADWKNHIDVVGFYFLDLATTYDPPADLVAFLAAGPPPVYIGFGSVVVDDPAAMSKIIFEATAQADVRALVSAGWGGLGGVSVPSHIFMLGNIPHDWLFANDRVSAVVHHGGAGTTAIGLAKGRPTVVIPFFGDQTFWGNMIYRSGAGPKPINHRDLTVKKLKEALLFATSAPAKIAASTLAQKIHDERGVDRGVEVFYRHLPLLNMRCDLDPSRLAVWWSPTHYLKLSAFSAQILADANIISLKSLILHRSKEHRPRKKAMESIMDSSSAKVVNALFQSIAQDTKFGGTISSKIDHGFAIAHGIAGAVASVHGGFQKHSLHYKKKSESAPEKSPPFLSEEKHADDDNKAGSFSSINPTPPSLKVPKSTGSLESNKQGLIATIKHLVQPKRSISLVTPTIMSVQNTWEMLKSSSGQIKYDSQCLTRIAEGRKAVSLSTIAERMQIISRFHAENANTPSRQEKYRSLILEQGASVSTMDSETGPAHHISLSGDSLTSTSAVHRVHMVSGEDILPSVSSHFSSTTDVTSVDVAENDAEDDTTLFVREMELAIQMSLAEAERGKASK